MPDTSHALTIIPSTGVETYRASTDAAGLCREIVKATAQSIEGRQYVRVEGWQSIAVAHGCTASSLQVERVEGGFRATGQVRRMDTGAVIAEAEGFVGEDEVVWFGGEAVNKWGKKKTYTKRPDFAIRAMAQTRAISRACRSAFAHVVVMIDKNLSTTPAEEMQGIYPTEDEAPPQGAPGSAGAGPEFRPPGRRSNDGDFVEEARRDGTLAPNAVKGQMPGTPTPEEAREAKIRAATEKRIAALKEGAPWTRDALDQFWKDDKKWIDWMSDPSNEALSHYERFTDAFAEAEISTVAVA